MIQEVEQTHEQKVEMYMKCTKNELVKMLMECNKQLDAAIKNCNIPVVSIPVKITKCKIFKSIDSYKRERELNEWLSSNKIVIKHTNQSEFREPHKKTRDGDYYTYGTLITIYYEDV